MDLDKYLRPTQYIESDHSDIIAFTNNHIAGVKDPKTKAIRLFYAVRDNIKYDPYTFNLKPDQLKASYVLKQKKTYCVPKAVLMTSVIRAAGIPARLGYANLINHTISNDLKTILNTNVLAWHGYTEVYLKDSWIRITPAFNVELCKYLNVPPVEFDGESHAIFPSADNDGNKHMEYIEYHGTFDDVPLETIVKSMMEHYPMLMKHDELVP